jgi:hypothetical protein
MTAQPNQHGVRWARSSGGKLDIALREDNGKAEVWAMYPGTHDLAPLTRKFTGPDAQAAARAYANTLWSTR